MRTALSIAGSDSSGGAGIQADLKTMTMNGVFAMSAVTALTAQNTTGVRSVMEATPAFLADELDAVFEDIRPDAVKTGMVSSSALIRVIAQKLRQYEAKNIVVDPVMVATSGARLLQEEALQTLKTELLPLADVVTPNIPEAEILADMSITNAEEMRAAAKQIHDAYGCAVTYEPMAGAYPFMVKDGTVVCGYQTDEMKEFLKTMHQWYEEGLIWQDFMSNPDFQNPPLDVILADRTGVYYGEVTYMATITNSDPDGDIRFVAIPDFVKNKGDTIPFKEERAYTVATPWSISSACEDPELVMRWCNYLYTDEGALVLDNACGSGSTCVAAVEEGRNYIGMDNGTCENKNSPFYCRPWAEVAATRIEAVHG